ncbi:MAG: branched-chain amino acid ABC transporter substrate-binding protein [Rhodobacteraceae bacterium]|nr:branched-chain amino acid ABC transporter substrate-binding protein [Paracoccaceae bacterium]
MSKFTVATVAGLALTAATALSSTAFAEIKIATAGPMTGQYAAFGEQMTIGAEAAVADINAAGGVLGQQLVLEIGDDACDPKQAVSVANQFVGDGVVFVAGHFCSGSSIPASSVYAEESVIQISPASTNPKFTDERPNPDGGTYRVCGRDDQQGEVAGNYLATSFEGKKVAFLHDKTAYGKGLADATMGSYEAAGGEPALYEAITAGEKDYSAIVTKLKDLGADALYLGGYHTEAGLLVRQMRDQGMSTQMISGDALVTDEYWAITGDAGEGTLMTFSPNPEKNPAAAEVVKKLKDAGKTTEGYVLYTYAAIQAWATAAEAAGSVDYDPMVAALNEGDFSTILGDLAFDDKGDVSLPGYVFYEWKNGGYAETE